MDLKRSQKQPNYLNQNCFQLEIGRILVIFTTKIDWFMA